MRALLTATAILALIAAGCSGRTETAADEEILRVLELQRDAWNRADIEGFMSTYLDSDGLTFQSGNSRTHGWSNVLARYKRNYSPETMGRLDFSDLAVQVLSDDAAYVLGRFHLDIGGEKREGLFTLILKRTDDGWRIVHDHTSSE